MFSMLFSSPASILIIIILNSDLDILLIFVLIKSLAMISSCSFFWCEFIHLVILPESLGVCVCEREREIVRKACRIPAPESNGYIKKKFKKKKERKEARS